MSSLYNLARVRAHRDWYYPKKSEKLTLLGSQEFYKIESKIFLLTFKRYIYRFTFVIFTNKFTDVNFTFHKK